MVANGETARNLLGTGVKAIRDGDYEKAEQAFVTLEYEGLWQAEDEPPIAIIRSQAAIRAVRAELVLTLGDMMNAAILYREAADLLIGLDDNDDVTRRGDYRYRTADLLVRLGEETWHRERFEEAIKICDELVQAEHARDRVSIKWAETQTLLGNAYRALTKLDHRRSLFDSAISAYRAALTEWTNEAYPNQWAKVQFELAQARFDFGQGEKDIAYLRDAKRGFEKLDDFWTSETAPITWAEVKNQLGWVAIRWSERHGGTHRLKQTLENLEDVFRATSIPPSTFARSHNTKGATNSILAELSLSNTWQAKTYSNEAKDALMSASRIWTKETDPSNWASVQNNLGNVFSLLAHIETSRRSAHLEDAVDAYRTSLDAYSKENSSWALTALNLARILLDSISVSSKSGLSVEAESLARRSMTVYTKRDYSYRWGEASTILASALIAQINGSEDANKVREAREALNNADQIFYNLGDRTYTEDYLRNLRQKLEQRARQHRIW